MSRRVRIQRTVRIWRLTARNGGRYVALRVNRLRKRDPVEQQALDDRFVIRTAEDVATQLGQMKGALMKVGQLLGFILESLPDDAQAALATLQADAPPMAPELAARTVRDELGADPRRLFLDWEDEPIAAASVGQVHRAVLRDGRVVAVKVQYPGVGDAIGADLDNAELLYGLFAAFALKGLDPHALVDELRNRMTEELDYRREAAHLRLFAEHYAGHPWVRTPVLVPEYSTAKVLTTEWIDGLSWAEFVAQADDAAKRRAGEIIWRFAQASVHRLGAFNGDPHPGNYRFAPDGSVTFLDFGMVKRWEPGEWERLSPCLDAILARDADALLAAMESVDFVPAGHHLDPQSVYDYVSTPYRPYLTDHFRFTREFVRDTIQKILDVKGPHAEAVEQLNLPASFVILDRVVWGVSALLGKLEIEAPWRQMLLGYRIDDSSGTELGDQEQLWWLRRATPR